MGHNAINGNVALGAGTIKGNQVAKVGAAFNWTATTPIDSLDLNQTGTGSLEGKIRASVGSVWTDGTTGVVYQKTTDVTTATGWKSI